MCHTHILGQELLYLALFQVLINLVQVLKEKK